MDVNLHEYFSKRKESVKQNLSFSLVYFLYMLGWGFVNPVFSIKVNNITGSFFLSGIFFSLWGGLKTFLNIFAGLLSDRMDVKRIIQYSLLTYSSVVSLGYFLVGSVIPLFFIRVIHVIAGTFVWTGYWVYLRRKSGVSVEKLCVPRTFIKAAKLVGPFIGGIVATYVFPGMTFLMLSGASFISFLLATFKLESLPGEREDHLLENFSEKLGEIFAKAKHMFPLGMFLVVITLTIRSFVQYFPLLLEQEGFSPEVIGFMFSLNLLPGVVASIPLGALSEHVSKEKPLLCGFALLSLGYLLFGLASNLLVLAVAIFILGIGSTLVYPLLNSLVSEEGDEDDKGKVTGIGESFKDIGGFIGPLIFGMVSTLWSLRTGFMVLVFLNLVPVVLILSKKTEF